MSLVAGSMVACLLYVTGAPSIWYKYLSFILEKLPSFCFKYSTYSLEFILWSHFFLTPSAVCTLSLKDYSSGFYPNSPRPFFLFLCTLILSNLAYSYGFNHKCWHRGRPCFWVSDPHLWPLILSLEYHKKHFKLFEFPNGTHISLSSCECE